MDVQGLFFWASGEVNMSKLKEQFRVDEVTFALSGGPLVSSVRTHKNRWKPKIGRQDKAS